MYLFITFEALNITSLILMEIIKLYLKIPPPHLIPENNSGKRNGRFYKISRNCA